MKTFSATHLNKHAQEVFAAVVRDGSVMIKHDRYHDKTIIITAKEYCSIDEYDTAELSKEDNSAC